MIPVGLYYPAGDFAYLFFADDADAGQNTSVRYRNPQFHEGPGAPIAQDDTFTVIEDSTNNLLAVLANDTDPGDTLTITSVDTTGTQGTVFIHDNGTPADPSDDGINYSTSIGFTGTDSFSYTIEDSGGLSASATVTVTVDPLDFALTASPSIVEVFAGDDALFQIDVSPVGGFTDDVTLTVPASPGAVFAPPVIVGGSGSSVLTVPTDAAGTLGLSVVGTSGSLIRLLDFTLTVVDFALTVSPSTLEVIVGDDGHVQVDVIPLAGFTDDVALTVPDFPGAVFTPSVIAGGSGSSVLTLPTVAKGAFGLSVIGTSGLLTHPVDITLDVVPPPPDFALTVSPSAVELTVGNDALFQINVTPVAGFTSDVTLTVPDFPGAFFTPSVITEASGSSVLTLPTVATGSFPILIHGTYGTPGAAVETNLVVTFNENVVKGTGNITIVETGVGTFEAIPVNTGQVSVSGPMLSIDPAGTLANGTAYHVLIDATAIDDTSGNSFAGLELATDWDFTTTTVGVITHAVGITLDVLDPPTSP